MSRFTPTPTVRNESEAVSESKAGEQCGHEVHHRREAYSMGHGCGSLEAGGAIVNSPDGHILDGGESLYHGCVKLLLFGFVFS